MDEPTPAALSGIRVLDLATQRAEMAGRVFADLGVDVVKVEPPGGVATRRLPPFDGRNGESLVWAAVGLGKRSVVLDLDNPGDRERIATLADGADVFVESFDPGTLDGLGLGYEALAARNPGLVYASVTPYGQDGPRATWPATDLTLEAAGGLIGMQGDGDRPPVPIGYPQASFHAGAQAAADAIVALHERERSGFGQYLDVSMQAAVVWTLMNATGFPPNTGANPPGYCENRAKPAPELAPGLRVPRTWPCKDGLIACTVTLGEIGGRTMQAVMAWAEAEGALPAALCGRDWRTWMPEVRDGSLPVETMMAAVQSLHRFFATKTKLELQQFGVAKHVLISAIYDVRDLTRDPQLTAREYWTEVGGRLHPGPFAKLSATPVRVERAAPALGADQDLLAQPRETGRTAPSHRGEPREGAFAGLKVADFAWVGVGPIISKALADHGATVIHVETARRPDVLRTAAPFKHGEPGLDRAQFMANFNSSKLGLALDLAAPGGPELARRLIDWADVVVESFTPGVMERHGLAWEQIRGERPDLVMLSTCLRGQTGPERTYAGFGGQGACLAGIHGITGWPDRDPCGPWGAYTDFINPRFGVAALASALIHRGRTGEGQHIDLGQVEAGIRFIEPLVLDYTVNGVVAGPHGLESNTACPHGTYRCAGEERYVAIAAETAEQWRALGELAPLNEFAGDEYDSLEARLDARDRIDAALRDWCATQDPFGLAERLCAAGVPAAVVQWPGDLYEDPQLGHRGFFVTLDHTVMGPTPYDGLATRFSATPGRLRKAAPCLGEDTGYVLSELLGCDDAAIAAWAEAGVLS